MVNLWYIQVRLQDIQVVWYIACKFIYKNVAFYNILYLWLYYWAVDRELSRNFLVDPSRRQGGHPCCIRPTFAFWC